MKYLFVLLGIIFSFNSHAEEVPATVPRPIACTFFPAGKDWTASEGFSYADHKTLSIGGDPTVVYANAAPPASFCVFGKATDEKTVSLTMKLWANSSDLKKASGDPECKGMAEKSKPQIKEERIGVGEWVSFTHPIKEIGTVKTAVYFPKPSDSVSANVMPICEAILKQLKEDSSAGRGKLLD